MLKWFKKDKPFVGPDFSAVDSLEKAEELFRKGELHKLLLLPAEFGGQDVPENVVYVPEIAIQMKAQVDFDIIGPMIEQGTVRRYQAVPEYEGNSFVPSSIKVVAYDPGRFEASLDIWGKAVQPDKQ